MIRPLKPQRLRSALKVSLVLRATCCICKAIFIRLWRKSLVAQISGCRVRRNADPKALLPDAGQTVVPLAC